MASQCQNCRAVHPDGWTTCRFCGAGNPAAVDWSLAAATMQCPRCRTVNVLGWTRCSNCRQPSPYAQTAAPARTTTSTSLRSPTQSPPLTGTQKAGGIIALVVGGAVVLSYLNGGGATPSSGGRNGDQRAPQRDLTAAECQRLSDEWEAASDKADVYDALINGGPLPDTQRREYLRVQGEAVRRMTELLDRLDAGGCFD